MDNTWLDKILNTASTIVPAVFSPKSTPAPTPTPAASPSMNWTPFVIGGAVLLALVGFLALRRR